MSCLAAKGAHIIASDRTDDNLQGDQIITGCLTDPDFANHLPDQVVSQWGRLDIIVNNAGVIARGDVTQNSDADLALLVGRRSTFSISRAAIPQAASQGGGLIINTCLVGAASVAQRVLYCMTKAALASLTECRQRSWHQNIRVNGICLNEVNTPMLRTGFEMRGMNADTAIEALNASVPLGRIAEPEDIADVAVSLWPQMKRVIFGALIEVNGGKAVS